MRTLHVTAGTSALSIVLLVIAAGCGTAPTSADPQLGGETVAGAKASSALTISVPLALNVSSVTSGQTLSGSVTWKNGTGSNYTAQGFQIKLVPPGAPLVVLSPQVGAVTLASRATQPLSASRTFDGSEPTGTWTAYATYQDAAGGSHNGPSISFSVTAPPPPPPPPPPPGSAPTTWVTAYYPAWQTGVLPVSAIDFGAISHIAHFSVFPKSTGALDTTINGTLDATASATVVNAAHAAGKKALITIGGDGSLSAFEAAVTDSVRPTLVANIVNLCNSRNYDGIDVDFEPLGSVDATNYRKFITDLRAALGTTKLITAALPVTASAIVLPVQSSIDQINLMTYDISGPYQGWVTWHNAPLYNGGLTFPSTGGPLPSCDYYVQQWVSAGFTRSRLGIGIDFYGYVWHGATAPYQSISGVTMDPQIPYSQIMDTLYTTANYRWDTGAASAYLSMTSPSVQFVSYDDDVACKQKVTYSKTSGIGGVIIWELAGGYRTSQPAGSRDVLLQAIKSAWLGN